MVWTPTGTPGHLNIGRVVFTVTGFSGGLNTDRRIHSPQTPFDTGIDTSTLIEVHQEVHRVSDRSF